MKKLIIDATKTIIAIIRPVTLNLSALSMFLMNILDVEIPSDIIARIMSKILTAILAPYKPLPHILFTVVLIL